MGNPNAGKTTLFNSLTGSHQKVGNYAGVTVEKVTGQLVIDDLEIDCIDVPGLYSLSPVSQDERVAAEVIEGKSDGARKPDLLVCVVDSTNLERNLYFVSQLVETGLPIVIALTMVDRLSSLYRSLDIEQLSSILGLDVVALVGNKDRGLDELKSAIQKNLTEPHIVQIDIGLPQVLEEDVNSLRERFARSGAPFTKSEIRRALFHPTPEMANYLSDFPEVREAFDRARENVISSGLPPTLDVTSRFKWSKELQEKVVRVVKGRPAHKSTTDKIDAILTHRVFGLAIFVGLMYLVFQSIYTFAQPLMDGIQAIFIFISNWVSPLLVSSPILQSLLVDGLLRGVGSVVAFLPQILILFFFIAVLEGTGYLARAAFLMDRLLGWCGLNGRAFIPLLSSFACAIPGIMAARVMPDTRSRLATILVAPLMSCSARLPVYLLLIGTFIQPKFGALGAGLALFAMHLVGVVVAVPIVFLFNRSIFRGKRLPFVLELPPYQWPNPRDVWLTMWTRGRIFLETAGTIIVVMSVIIWALSYFPRLSSDEVAQIKSGLAVITKAEKVPSIDSKLAEAELSNSLLGRFGKAIEPAFIPAGFDWRITTSILSAFPARETVVPSLGIVFALGKSVDEKNQSLQSALSKATWPDGRPLFTAWTAVGLMVFFALCAQCFSTLATVRRETNSWKWPVVMFCYMTALAYVAAVGIHQLALRIGG